MTDVSESVIQAVQILTENAISQLKYDKTVQAEIYSVVDLDTGEYKVRYNGNIFSAYSEDTSKTYEEEDRVFVKVPEGDFSNRKIITSLVTADSVSATALTALANSIVDISPTFDVIYANEDWAYDASGVYGVIAGVPEGYDGSIATICEGPSTFASDEYHKMFQTYSSQYEYIRIKASFQTQFHSTHSAGNYGLQVEFYTSDNANKSVTYTFDIENFNGNPYSFTVYSTQQVVVQVTKGYLVGLKSIKLFEKGFEYDEVYKNGQATGQYNSTVANIFVKDIQISYVDIIDLSSQNYYLTISAPKGMAFTSRVTDLSLVANLIYQGENIIDKSKCEFQWYERDLSVMVGSRDYNKDAGFGWKPIEDEETKTLELNINQVAYMQQYKLVLYYGDDVTLTAAAEVINQQANYSFYLAQTTQGANIYLQIVNSYDDEELVGDWYMSLPDNTYSALTKDDWQSQIEISQYLQYTSVKFYVAVYDSEGTYLGVLEQNIVNADNEDAVTLTYTGDDQFRYDANGDVTLDEASKERNLEVNVSWKTGYGTTYSIQWYMKDSNGIEHELPGGSEDPYDPPSSMMEEMWVDTTNILHYNIRQKFKVNYVNNTIVVKIRTITGETYSFEKEIIFLKDGDQGTNGTTYTCAIRTCDQSGVKQTGFQPLVWNNGWTGSQTVRCYVYNDGVPINGADGYSISYKWTGHNVTVAGGTTTSGVDRVLVRGASSISASTTSSALLDFYVKVQVTITDKEVGDTSVTIYNTYPLDVVIGSVDKTAVDIDDIPLYIKYNSSGEEPSYYSNDINFYYNGVAYNQIKTTTNGVTTGYISSLNEDLLVLKQDDDGLIYVRPTSSFIFENVKANESNIAVLELDVPESTTRLIHPIVMYLDTYGNEAINGWDGTALELDEKGQYILAPQIGAGVKNGDNTFTGVVMGKDTQQELIGLYGYENGISTFGFKQDGSGYIGASTKGRIIFDGNESTISSANYSKQEAGMQIILAEGSIDTGSWSFDGEKQQFLFHLADDSSSYFRIIADTTVTDEETGVTTTSKSTVFNVSGSDNYYLQSKGFSSTDKTGTKIDLANGRITSYDFNIQTPYFKLRSTSQSANLDEPSETDTTTGGTFFFNTGGKGSFNVQLGGSSVISLSSSGGTIKSVDGSTFYINLASGALKCSSANIEGRVVATSGSFTGAINAQSGTISGNLTVGGSLTGGGVTFSSGGISCSGFSASSSGINATSGKIGGWTISNSSIIGGSTKLYSSGKIEIGQSMNVGTYLKAETIKIDGAVDGELGIVSGGSGQTNTKGLGISSNGTIKLIASGDASIDCNNLWLMATGSVYIGAKIEVATVNDVAEALKEAKAYTDSKVSSSSSSSSDSSST